METFLPLYSPCTLSATLGKGNGKGNGKAEAVRNTWEAERTPARAGDEADMEAYRVGILNDDVQRGDEAELPFKRGAMNDGYASLLARARTRGLPLVVATDAAYDAGKVREGWIHDGQSWYVLRDVPLAAVYDQFDSGAPAGRRLTSELAARGLRVCNDPRLSLVVDDKLLTWANFPWLLPYTHYFHAGTDDPQGVLRAFLEGCRRSGIGELTAFVAKPQTGWGAKNLHRFTSESVGALGQIPPGEYVLQPFLESGEGIPELGVRGRHDFRIVLEQGRFVSAVIRQPAHHDWAANYFQAEDLIFVTREADVPSDLLEAARVADLAFQAFYPRLVSYDLARLGSTRVICWEMNARPGMCADSLRPEDQTSSAQIQEAILNCMEIMVGWRR